MAPGCDMVRGCAARQPLPIPGGRSWWRSSGRGWRSWTRRS